MTDLIVAFILLVFIFVGFSRPNIAIMGYVWIDLVKPQKLAYGFIAGKPLSMIIAVVCILSLIFNYQKLNKLENKKITTLFFLFAIWITITTTTSLFPDYAWVKWDWAFKTVLVAVLIPFTIKTREDLEALIWVFLASVAFFTISAGVKTALSGGGYGARLISGGDNSGLSESSTLALVAAICLPLLVNFINNSLLMDKTKLYKLFMLALICTAVFTVIGSYARTGLIGLFIFSYFMFIKSNRKVAVLFSLMVAVLLIYNFAPDTWFDRMGTVETASEDSSALGRLVVWKWTTEFATTHFFGGGFHAYIANAGLLNLYHDNPKVIFDHTAKAFHSIYFEVLGEHGFVGLTLYLTILLALYIQLRKLAKDKTDKWKAELAKSLTQALYIFCACGAFVGVAFQPILYILAAFVISLSNLKTTNEQC
jgi:probable O-glycosylation ligase (exosortase A-associated)